LTVQNEKLLNSDKRFADEIEKINREKDSGISLPRTAVTLNTILGWTKILLTKEINEAARRTALETIEKARGCRLTDK
jgi:hypothetical protein